MLGEGLTRGRPPTAARLLDLTLDSMIVLVGAVLAVYPQMLRAYLQFPINVFTTDGGAIGVAVREYLGWSQMWPAAVALVIGVCALLPPAQSARRWSRVALSVVAVAGLVTLPRSPHPIAHSLALQIRWALAARARVVPSLQRAHRHPDGGPAATSAALTLAEPLRADHVFVIALEGVTADAFEREFLPMAGGFYASERRHAAYYSRYYATNLDSYTSLIAMLTGVQVPYRAYSDETWFKAVNDAPSIVQAFRERGARTTFLGTYAYQPFVPVRTQWDQVLDRSRLQGLDRWVSLGTSRMEAATEDRAALATIIDGAATVPRSLILQEMVYGHSTAWQERTGFSQLAYYDQYLRELLQGLRSRELDSRSLIIVVSDHGDRALSAVAGNYRVPLLIVGPMVRAGTVTDFLSHQDFPAILSAILTGTPAPPARPSQIVVGATDRWVYGRIDEQGASVFIDDGSGSVLASAGSPDARRLFDDVQAAVNAFGARFGPTRP